MSRGYKWVRLVLGAAIVFGLLIGCAGAIIGYHFDDQQSLSALLISLGAEVLGAAVIFILLERIVAGRQREEELKTQFIGLMSSADNDAALRGAAELQARGWLASDALHNADMRYANLSGVVLRAYRQANGELKPPDLQGVILSNAELYGAKFLDGANLSGAKLQSVDARKCKMPGACLVGADLQGADFSVVPGDRVYAADLSGANLEKAILRGADFKEAQLREAKLRGADLRGAELVNVDLQGADMREADLSRLDHPNDLRARVRKGQCVNLTGAYLRKANLTGADLRGAIMVGAHLSDAKFNEETTLPDGTKWTPDTDMTRFTDASLGSASLMIAVG